MIKASIGSVLLPDITGSSKQDSDPDRSIIHVKRIHEILDMLKKQLPIPEESTIADYDFLLRK